MTVEIQRPRDWRESAQLPQTYATVLGDAGLQGIITVRLEVHVLCLALRAGIGNLFLRHS